MFEEETDVRGEDLACVVEYRIAQSGQHTREEPATVGMISRFLRARGAIIRLLQPEAMSPTPLMKQVVNGTSAVPFKYLRLEQPESFGMQSAQQKLYSAQWMAKEMEDREADGLLQVYAGK